MLGKKETLSVRPQMKIIQFIPLGWEGMEYIEMKKFFHRDVRANNVLVNADEQVKIADFGLARDEEYTASETSKYPVRWASPEVLSMRLFSSKADVWSFGVMITEVMTYGMKPYPSMNIEKVLLIKKVQFRRLSIYRWMLN